MLDDPAHDWQSAAVTPARDPRLRPYRFAMWIVYFGVITVLGTLFLTSVLRDLRWLLNTVPLGQTEDLSGLAQVRDSVLDYGMRDLAGVTLSGVDPTDLERMIFEAIKRFEPRILPRTLRVRAVAPEDPLHRNALAFEIEGELWGQPLPTSLYLKSEIDLEDGSLSVAERSGPGSA